MFSQKPSFFLILVCVFLLGLSGCGKEEIPANIVISADGYLEPGKKQSFSVYQLNKSNLLSENPTPLDFRIEGRKKNGDFFTICTNLDQSEKNNPTTCSFSLPHELRVSELFLNAYAGTVFKNRVFSMNLPVQKNFGFAIAPSSQKIYCGDWINLKLVAADSRSLSGIFKVPIRVRMTPPFGLTTLNRVVNTEIDGFANFTTFINGSSPPGIYRFEISSGNRRAFLFLPVSDAAEKATTLIEKVQAAGIPLAMTKTPSDENAPFTCSTPPQSEIISGLKTGNQQLFFDFNCVGSSYRSVEIWQNGSLLHQANLPIEEGNSSYPLPRNFISSIPVRVKTWFIRDNKIFKQDQAVIFERPGNNRVLDFLQKLIDISDKNITEPENLILEQSPVFSPGLTVASETRNWDFSIEPAKLGMISEVEPGSSSKQRPLKLDRGLTQCSNRFLIVENELDLSHYNFDLLKIHLGRRKFFSDFVAAIFHPVADIETILSETEARLARFSLLNLSGRLEELEKIEGLAIPICELIIRSDQSLKDRPEILQRANRLLHHLQNLIFLPVKPDPEFLAPLTIGPLKPFLENTLNSELIKKACKRGGKIQLKTLAGDYPVNLGARILEFNNRLGNHRQLQKIVNLRTDPVLIELVFNEKKSVE